MAANDVGALTEGLFRREAGRLVASLARVFGPSNIDLVEDVVQEALETALQAWNFRVPDNPVAWLSKVARNRAIDVIRRHARERNFAEDYVSQLDSGWTRSTTIEKQLDQDSSDENLLRMMFSLCHPLLSEDTHTTLILKFLCGFGTHELASAYLVSEETIKKRLARGRRKFREQGSLSPVDAYDADRLPSALNAIYLLFNEGFHGSHSTSPTRVVLCDEALRLCGLIEKSVPGPEVHALLALMHFHYARIRSRYDEAGEVIALSDQDRSAWDGQSIRRGIEHLGLSASGRHMSVYHIEAGIACKHCLASTFEDTDWEGILELYDLLFEINPSPLIQVIRSRYDEAGEVIALSYQDRSAWDGQSIRRGIEHLGLSASGRHMSVYHIEAGIACKHCLASTFEDTDWEGILELYNLLFEINPSPLIQVIRATVRAYAGNPGEALNEIQALPDSPSLMNYPFYWAARAEVHSLNGDTRQALEDYERAASLARNRVEENAWKRRIGQLSIVDTTMGSGKT